MAGQLNCWARVGAGNESVNHWRTAGWKRSKGLDGAPEMEVEFGIRYSR
jgi:hypothetical protein